MPQQPEIKTERLLLRPIDPEGDAQDILDYYSLEETVRYTAHLQFTTLSQARIYLEARATGPRCRNYSVCLPTSSPGPNGRTHRVIGLLGCRSWPEVGYTFNPAYHNKGYATEALRAFIPELFRFMPPATQPPGDFTSEEDEDGYDYALALCDAENGPSLRLLERTGFVKGEIIKNEFVSPLMGIRDAVPMFLPRPGKEVPSKWLQKKVEEEKPVPEV